MGERLLCTQEAGGSNPPISTISLSITHIIALAYIV